MKTHTLIILTLLCAGCTRSNLSIKTADQQFVEATTKLDSAKTEEDRFYYLSDAAKSAFLDGKYSKAEQYARELEALTSKYKGNWNYGNAIQDSNLVLGRLAVRNGNIDEAKKYLIASGHSPGSPQMDTFGPNMSLAKDLLAKGEKEIVLEYFELCRIFWEMHRGRLDEWKKDIALGKIPDFGASLDY